MAEFGGRLLASEAWSVTGSVLNGVFLLEQFQWPAKDPRHSAQCPLLGPVQLQYLWRGRPIRVVRDFLVIYMGLVVVGSAFVLS